MKGLTHFTVGVAAASCFPGAVAAGADGNPLYFILGGVCGLLSDTLDFKFYRFFYKQTLTVTPDPHGPDAQMIAGAVAEAFNRAHRTGKPCRIRLNTVKLGADRWQRYTVRFDVANQEVTVVYGPVVNTGGRTIEEVPGKPATATVKLECPVRLSYAAGTNVDIFDGPVFSMEPEGDAVVPMFIPWHREWTHSFVMGTIPALACTLAWGRLAGAVALAAFWLHVGADQLGFLGSNLFYPFSKRRAPGMKLTHSGEAEVNLGVIWCCCLLIFWNLQWHGLPDGEGVDLVRLVLLGALLPAGLWALVKNSRPDV